MNLISRYIIKEHLGPFVFALAVIMFVFVTKFIAQYIGKLFGKGLAAGTILEFVYLNLAWMLALAVPMAVLVASLMAFGRLSADNEITILKTAGINLYRVLTPVLLWGSLLTIAMIWYNNSVLPEFNHRAKLLSRSIGQKKPAFQLEEGIYFRQGNINILVKRIDRPLGNEIIAKSSILDPAYPGKVDKLKDITIFDYSTPNIQRTIVADNGYLVFDPARKQLVFNLFDGEIHEVSSTDYAEYRRIRFAKNVFYVEAGDQVFKRIEDEQRGDREMNIQMMKKEVARYQAQIQDTRAQNRLEIERYLPTPDSLAARLQRAKSTEVSIGDQARRIANTRALRKAQSLVQVLKSNYSSEDHFNSQIYKYEVEIYKKYSIPFACIVFILIGAPLGIRARKGSLGVGITFSVGFFLLYWACLIGGEELADREMVSPWLAMWFPNIAVGIFGLYLTIRTVQETTFIQWERWPKIFQTFFKGGH